MSKKTAPAYRWLTSSRIAKLFSNDNSLWIAAQSADYNGDGVIDTIDAAAIYANFTQSRG